MEDNNDGSDSQSRKGGGRLRGLLKGTIKCPDSTNIRKNFMEYKSLRQRLVKM